MNYSVLSSLVNIDSNFFSVKWSSEFYCLRRPISLVCFRLRTRHRTTPTPRNIPEKSSTRDKPNTDSIYPLYTSEDSGKYLHFFLHTSTRHHTTSGFDASGTQQPFNILPESFFLKEYLVSIRVSSVLLDSFQQLRVFQRQNHAERTFSHWHTAAFKSTTFASSPPFILHQPLADLPFPHSQNQPPPPCLTSPKTWSSCSR